MFFYHMYMWIHRQIFLLLHSLSFYFSTLSLLNRRIRMINQNPNWFLFILDYILHPPAGIFCVLWCLSLYFLPLFNLSFRYGLSNHILKHDLKKKNYNNNPAARLAKNYITKRFCNPKEFISHFIFFQKGQRASMGINETSIKRRNVTFFTKIRNITNTII